MGGVCAESAAAATLFFASYKGIPVSTTHTITGAIVGVGSADRMSAVRWNVASRVVWAWVFTIPGAALVAMLSYWVVAAGELMDRRAVFFLCSALICVVLAAVTPSELRWVGNADGRRVCGAGRGLVARPPVSTVAAAVEPDADGAARLTVAYDGAPFHGFAENDGVRTVMGELREALEKVVRQPVELVGAGRTDAGVHGWGQVVSCDLPDDIDLDAWSRRVNRMCGPAVVVRVGGVGRVAPTSAPASTASGGTTATTCWNAPQPNPFLGADVVARRPATVAAGDAAGVRPADRRARLLLVLPPPEGRRRPAPSRRWCAT